MLLLNANALYIPLADESVQCAITSPPYWGLRAYGTHPQVWLGSVELCEAHEWSDIIIKPGITGGRDQGGKTDDKNGMTYRPVSDSQSNTCLHCGAWRGELGLEPTPEMYVAHLMQVFREVRRVLRDDGTLWLNLGDSYISGKSRYSSSPQTISGKHRGEPVEQNKPDLYGHLYLKDKDLAMIPARVALALQADGWWLRPEIVWAKPNPMPESVTDRPTKAHEMIYLLSKRTRYYYNADAIREPHADVSLPRALRGVSNNHKWVNGAGGQTQHTMMKPRPNRRKEFDASMGGGGTSFDGHSGYMKADGGLLFNPAGRNKRSVWTVAAQPYRGAHFATFPSRLIEPMILAGSRVGDIVLDPFAGTATVGCVAIKHQRRFVGLELNHSYLSLATDRISHVQIALTLEAA